MDCARPALIVLLVSQIIAGAAVAGERTALRDGWVAVSAAKKSDPHASKVSRSTAVPPLDRVATAVDGAESSHGQDGAMWRPNPSGPQGPMQVSEAAATDVGGGDRFDVTQNRTLGRAYLAQLYGRYGNWPDAIAAYNWGVGKMDAWIKAGRPADQFLTGVAVYLKRVLHESGFCDHPEAAQRRQPSGRSRYSSEATTRKVEMEVTRDPARLPPDSFIGAACSAPDTWGGSRGFGIASSLFYKKLDQAMQLALQHAPASQHLALAPDDRPAVSWKMAMRRR